MRNDEKNPEREKNKGEEKTNLNPTAAILVSNALWLCGLLRIFIVLYAVACLQYCIKSYTHSLRSRKYLQAQMEVPLTYATKLCK